MASSLFLVLALALPISGIVLSNPLITFCNQNPDDSLVYVTVHGFLFFLLPFEFFFAISLLIFRLAAPQSTLFFIKCLSLATRVLVSATLLLEVPLMIHASLTETLTPDTLMVMSVVAAAAVIHNCTPFIGYFNIANQTAISFVPLCISTSIFLLIDPLLPFSILNQNTIVPVPIQLFILALNWLSFLLTVVLQFLRIIMATHGLQNLIPAVLIAHLVELMLALSFTTTLLIGYYVVTPLLVGII
jgi:hypothetical protein